MTIVPMPQRCACCSLTVHDVPKASEPFPACTAVEHDFRPVPPRQSFDQWALGLCQHVATRSKDPSTQVGAVIVRPDRTVASVGYNGFPRGVQDWPDRYEHRPTKLLMTVHAETNAIVTAREPLDGCTIYVSPLYPCAACAGVIVQSGIRRVVTPRLAGIRPEWAHSFDAAEKMFGEAGIVCEEIA